MFLESRFSIQLEEGLTALREVFLKRRQMDVLPAVGKLKREFKNMNSAMKGRKKRMAAKRTSTSKKVETAPAKAAEVKAEEAVKPVAAPVKEEVKAEVKAEEKKPAVKAPAKKTAEKAAEKAPAKKSTAKKVEKDMTTTLTIEFRGKDVTCEEIIEKVKADYAEKSGKKEIESLQLYVQPENDIVFYVADGVGGEEYSVEL